MYIHVIPPSIDKTSDYLGQALGLPGAGTLLFRQLLQRIEHGKVFASSTLFVPSQWRPLLDKESAPHYFDADELSGDSLNRTNGDGLLIVNARLDYRYDPQKLTSLLNPSGSAVVAVEIAPELAAPNEMVRRTSAHHIVGFRRILEDIIEPAANLEADFPAFLFFPPSVLQRLERREPIPLRDEALSRRLEQANIPLLVFRMGGQSYDLKSAQGLLGLLSRIPFDQLNKTDASAAVDPSARLIGPIWIGRGVQIEKNAIVAGPCILSDGVRIGAAAVVQRTLIAPNLRVEPSGRLKNTLYLSGHTRKQAIGFLPDPVEYDKGLHKHRDWPLISYVRLGKRAFDIVFSLVVLLLIIPFFPLIALMIKLAGPGPIFYRARRQGRHGKEFDCLKFRTMMVQADSLQERLRNINQVDGPQFKIDNDPRITGVGKFLRDTCIDELPQFINVLLGQMSVVGPRPSPESENEACPAWRDARLSVRPGITGLWQVCRTRQAETDFQEWIYYDTQYVRSLSFRQDLYICVKTASKLINTFLDQFG